MWEKNTVEFILPSKMEARGNQSERRVLENYSRKSLQVACFEYLGSSLRNFTHSYSLSPPTKDRHLLFFNIFYFPPKCLEDLGVSDNESFE